MTKPKETDLYEPVKSHFESEGYRVYGEVKGCDLIAQMGKEMTAVELKLSVSLKLIFQAMERKKTAHYVYVAIPRPKNARNKHYKDSIQLLKALGIGLLTVALDSPIKRVNVVSFPTQNRPPNNHKTRAIKKEVEGRSADYNKGGVTKRKIITAYRERSIRIAVLLDKHGQMPLKAFVNDYGEDFSISSILQRNFYHWFVRIEKGVYDLSEEGREALSDPQFKELVTYYRGLV